MCIGIPGQVINILTDDAGFLKGLVNFGGIKKEISLACTADVVVGDYVLAHAGLAISIVDEQEAQKIYQYLEEIDEIR